MEFRIEHRTSYRFFAPVLLGEHRLMLRPRDSHDLRLLDATLEIDPPAELRWVHDVFGNSIALATFHAPSDHLTVISRLLIHRYAKSPGEREIAPYALNYPFLYDPGERVDLAPTIAVEDERSIEPLVEWTRPFLQVMPVPTLALLQQLNQAIRADFRYEVRHTQGTQTARETLFSRTGTCRDFAMLLIEAARCLGFAARFVTGYLYDPALDGGAAVGIQGAAATHAWAEIFVPGAGWIEFDPTNNAIAGQELIRIATTRSSKQASPVSGTFVGLRADAAGLDVGVTVTALDPLLG